MNLLEKTQALMEIERSLSMAMERAEPWLAINAITVTNIDSSIDNDNKTVSTSATIFNPRVRPAPRTMDEVKLVLDVARNYSTRTSAPAGWNPMAPLVGFASPNPLPSQLRSGALAALELQVARREEINQRKQKQEQQQQKNKMHNENNKRQLGEEEEEEEEEQGGGTSTAASKKNKNSDHQPMNVDDDNYDEDHPPNSGEAKRRPQHLKQMDSADGDGNIGATGLQAVGRATAAAVAGRPTTTNRPAAPIDMNLSDSSSSSSSEGEDEEEDSE
jgi:Vitamin-D-receptor interacting Mediator subunit 4